MNIPCETCNHKNVCENTFDPYYYSECEYYEEPRPHGTWVWKEYDPDYDCGDIVCSKCSVVIYEGVPQAKLKDISWPFCPDCGADMRKSGEAE